MKIYKCEKCGSIDVFIECNETHHGLYCGDCGKWIKWLNKDEERLALRQIINQQSKNKDTIRKFAEWLAHNRKYNPMKENIGFVWSDGVHFSTVDEIIAEYDKENKE